MTATGRRTVLQLVDTLAIGGAERVALNLANLLPAARWRTILGTSRCDGALARDVAPHVGRLRLGRRGRFDLPALLRLRRFLREERVDLVHAHSTSLFLALAARRLLRRAERPHLVWHDHFGRSDIATRPVWLYGPAARAADGVVAVNPKLAAWSCQALGLPTDRVWYLPNFVVPGSAATRADTQPPPGRPGRRIVCVASFREQKDHANLVDAFARVTARGHRADLLLAGGGDPVLRDAIAARVVRTGLEDRVHVMGEVTDVPALLAQADIGVLASRSEGLPLALLEYGTAGLAVVSTSVGQCAEVLADGDAGLLVPPADPEALADALVSLLSQPERRRELGRRLARRIAARYSPDAAIAALESVYRAALGNGEPAWSAPA